MLKCSWSHTLFCTSDIHYSAIGINSHIVLSLVSEHDKLSWGHLKCSVNVGYSIQKNKFHMCPNSIIIWSYVMGTVSAVFLKKGQNKLITSNVKLS